MTQTAQTENGSESFSTPKEAAETFTKERSAETKAFGVHFTTIPQNDRAAFVYQLQRLDGLGWTLAAAIDFIEKHGKAAPSLPLGTNGMVGNL